MAVLRTEAEVHLGKLISSIQREWTRENSDLLVHPSAAELTFKTMEKAHMLLQAEKAGDLYSLLGDLSIIQFLGARWVATHPNVQPQIDAIDRVLLRKPSA